MQRINGELRFVPPKTHRSTRSMPLSELTVSALTLQRARQAVDWLLVGAAWEDHGLVFATHLGTPLEPRNVNRRFSAARSAAGLEWVSCTTFGMLSPRSCLTKARSSERPWTCSVIRRSGSPRTPTDTYFHPARGARRMPSIEC